MKPTRSTFRCLRTPAGPYANRQSNQTVVEPFPPTGVKHQLVAYGSELPNHPLWSVDGKELFYNRGPSAFASVSTSTQRHLYSGSRQR